MKVWLLSLSVIMLGMSNTNAQKINIQRWVKHNVDSLHKIHVDTIEYYHMYCSECTVKKSNGHYCETGDGYTQMENIIIYRQHGKSFALEFDCDYLSDNRLVYSSKSITYFLSIIPTLNSRDKKIQAMNKKHKFLPPIPTDGVSEEAIIYCNKIKQKVFMRKNQKTDKNWKQYFWIDNQTKLFELIAADIYVTY